MRRPHAADTSQTLPAACQRALLLPAPAAHFPRGGDASAAGALIGITVLAALDQYVAPELDTLLLTASFGATAVLLYAAPTSPLAQPLNLGAA